ncbi:MULTISPECIES: hypothetical protein [unclassified Paenibacillus]|uniref:hypothetical protein n=1 Tax=unclassified Paenibacillus TaxID=185978 RepID=UPI00089AF378|nr:MULTISPECIES: hypothetical protein [unclassified Paenibacillus]OMC65326.1 hypothetical protein BK126_21690 [Paenibacillus sp. FSL H7-0326]SDX17341.1 hypothetical protein SAMN05518848_10532 [Paenibacillus sp. PDC88]
MNIGSARQAAVNWVTSHGSQCPGYLGAYFSGSTVPLPDNAMLPPASDVDIVLVTQEVPSIKLGKFRYQNVLLEVTYLPWDLFDSVEKVLTNYHLAGSFRTNTIIADPYSRLYPIYQQVSQHYAQKSWVEKRCKNALHKIEAGLQSIDMTLPLYDRITALLFPAAITTHVLLTAALQNPTVRLRYLRVREVLAQYNQLPVYTELLQLLGCDQMTAEQVRQHLEQLEITFDTAADVSSTPFFFSSDITVSARPIVIEGSRELIESGNHLEAVFWIAATFARCHKILDADASPETKQSLAPAFQALINDLGIGTPEDYLNRAGQILNYLPALSKTADDIINAHPQIWS